MAAKAALSTEHPNPKVRERAYAAHHALRTIQEHAGIVSNKALMRDVKTLAQQQVKALTKVAKPAR